MTEARDLRWIDQLRKGDKVFIVQGDTVRTRQFMRRTRNEGLMVVERLSKAGDAVLERKIFDPTTGVSLEDNPEKQWAIFQWTPQQSKQMHINKRKDNCYQLIRAIMLADLYNLNEKDFDHLDQFLRTCFPALTL